MSELIDREAVREFIKSYSHSTDVVYHMEKHLYEVPTIDAVPVVRCGECKWLFNDSNTFFKPCEVIIPEKDWYCAYGERREG